MSETTALQRYRREVVESDEVNEGDKRDSLYVLDIWLQGGAEEAANAEEYAKKADEEKNDEQMRREKQELDQHIEDILKRANENQNARSPAPTLIDDSSSESELRSRSPLGCRRSRMQSIPIPSGMHLNVPDCVLPYLRWSNMASRIQQCLDYSRDDHRIEYMLAPPDSDPQSWIDKVLNYGLHVVRGKDVCFKIGISYWPATRFNYEVDRRLKNMKIPKKKPEDTDLLDSLNMKQCETEGPENHKNYVDSFAVGHDWVSPVSQQQRREEMKKRLSPEERKRALDCLSSPWIRTELTKPTGKIRTPLELNVLNMKNVRLREHRRDENVCGLA